MLNATRLFVIPCLACLLVPSLAFAQLAGPDAYGHTADTTDYDFVDLSVLGDANGPTGDDTSASITLPWSFNFYGVDYDFIAVNSNGGATLNNDGSAPSVPFTNSEFPTAGTPHLAPFWDDFNPTQGGAIYTYHDTAEDRFIVSWQDVPHYYNVDAASFQLQLYSTGVMEFHYADVLFGDGNDNGGSATIGINDFDSGDALQLSFNTAFVFDGDAFSILSTDTDGDGVPDLADCAPEDPTLSPNALEVCGDGIDNDCDGFDNLSDLDLDGDIAIVCGGNDCDDSDPLVSTLIDLDGDGSNACEDCDDAEPAAFPGNPEVCDAIDNDCDGVADTLDDADGDGFTSCAGDCDDADPLIFPGAVEELCDTIDNDCDELTADLGDGDLDGSDCDVDCDDTDPTVFPGAVELCDTIDSDCDGLDDADDLSIGAVAGGPVSDDAPGLAFDNNTPASTTIDMTGDAQIVAGMVVGFNIEHTWSGDVTATLTSPAGTAVILTDGNGGGSDNFTGTFFLDAAPTAIGDGSAPFTGEFSPEEPLAILDGEAVDGIWTLDLVDCCGGDDGVLVDWSLQFVGDVLDDADGDGSVDSCGDCDATDDTIFPGAPEVCGDAIDQDCDGVDELADNDGDLEDDILCGGTDCDDSDIDINTADDDTDGFSPCDGDCDDDDIAVNPDAEEICGDTIDNDCLDGDLLGDEDGDTFSSEFCGGTDCDDDDPLVSPGAVDDLCDGLDPNCDDLDIDLDVDGFEDAECDGDDCNDADAAINPDALELCDTIDGDCDGIDDAFDLSIGAVAGGPVSDDAPGLAFDNNTPASTTIDMTGDAQIVAGMVVGFNIEHTWSGDVTATLTSPAGTAVILTDGNGGGSDNFTGTFFLDAAPTAIGDGSAPFTGEFSPEEPLAILDGEAVDGIWTLDLVDCCGGDDGVLVDWSLQFVGDVLGDADGDGSVDSCGDCDATDDTIFPGAEEICDDTIDQDCSGADDLDDEDEDLFSNVACGGDDCDDTDATINPDALELCNDGIDQNCNADEAGDNPDDLFDNDLDGSLCDADCDDEDPAAFPGSPEICDDLIDNNCDGLVDTGDADLDGFDCDVDCDDTNPAIFPGAPEVLCDLLDNDCDPTTTPDNDDGDLDSFLCLDDCDDSNPAINPAALEIPCDGIDNDCDDEIDTDGGADNDVDGDGATCDVDCDDNDDTRSPDFNELCDDGIDNDCDPSTDDDQDADLDGFGCIDDCDDEDPLTFPGAPEICADSIDQDCDGTADELAADEYDLADGEAVRIGLCSFSFEFCGGFFDEVFVNDNGILSFAGAFGNSAENVTDFEENAPLVAGLWTNLDPGTAGTVEVIEDDGVSVEVIYTGVSQFGLPGTANTVSLTLWQTGGATLDYGNVDEQGGMVGFTCGTGGIPTDLSEPDEYGVGTHGSGTDQGIFEQFSDLGSPNDLEDGVVELCLTTDGDDGDGDGWTAFCGDCDDADDTTFPGADELCDTIDNDCDGEVDDVDNDDDGFIDEDCGGDDCDDSDADSNPDGIEICDGLDNDCDGDIEDGGADEDGDGFQICGGDCNDTDAAVNPDAEEVCDLIDNDCDGVEDNGFNSDLDDDGFVSVECGGDDCDDQRASSNPDGVEVCDLADNDCNDEVDDIDVDEDGFLDADCDGDDCDDANADTNPGADEVPYDGIDNDCDGEDTVDADGDGFADTSVDGGIDCDDGDDAVFPGTEEICDDEIDNDCDETTDADDEECGACADCATSVGASPQGTGLLGLLMALAIGFRRRRS